MTPGPYTCGIVVPVRDEADTLRRTIPALLAATQGERARIVWVCNGCRDDSARVIRQLGGPGVDVLELNQPGKTRALQAGDEALDADVLFPRLYLDADTALRPGDVSRLLEPLRHGYADLVAAAHAFDLSRASRTSAAIARCWLSLPFAQESAMLGAIAVSRLGRACWKQWPDIIADDMFVSALIPKARQQLVPDAIATTRPPPAFIGWVRMRARWLRGERQLRTRGLSLPTARGQRARLRQHLARREKFFGAFAFCLARLFAIPLAWRSTDIAWKPERPRPAASISSPNALPTASLETR